MRWTRLEKIESIGVVHSGKNFFPGFERNRCFLPFLGEFVDSKVPKHVFDLRRRTGRAKGKEGSVDEEKKENSEWKRFLRALYTRGVGECKEMVDGGVEVLVSEREDERRLVGVLGGMDSEQRRKCKVTFREIDVSSLFDG